ncbi:MAG: hypothetical protein R6W70_11005 [bacterium]
MGIGEALLKKENLELVTKKAWKKSRPLIIDKGMEYYDKHPKDVERIVANLEYMDMPSSGTFLDNVLKEISAHYFEKLFVLTAAYEAYWVAEKKVEMDPDFKAVQDAVKRNEPVFIGQSHFGASYLIAISLMVRDIDFSFVGRFPEPVGSMLKKNADFLTERYKTASTRIINIADKNIDVPYEMFSALIRKEVISNVFDENNEFCKKVELLGKPLMGGSGMDEILKRFSNKPITVVTPFVVRTSGDSFRFELDLHSPDPENIIDSFYRSLEKRVEKYPEQWYFIHELHNSFPSSQKQVD